MTFPRTPLLLRISMRPPISFGEKLSRRTISAPALIASSVSYRVRASQEIFLLNDTASLAALTAS